MNDAPLVEVLKRILADVGDVAGDLLRPELGVPGLDFIFFDVDGGENVVPHNLFIDEHGVFVVVALPGQKADEHVFAQRNLAVVGGRAVGDDLALFDMLAVCHHRALVDAGALIGTHKLY